MDHCTELADRINAAFAEVDQANAALHDKRLAAGRLLLEAQLTLKQGFRQWALANVKRDISDVYACLRLAKAGDPVAARELEKADHREAKQRQRERKVVGDVTHTAEPAQRDRAARGEGTTSPARRASGRLCGP
jgi:hypothetical protein